MKPMKVLKFFLNTTLIVLNIVTTVIIIKKLQEDKEIFERDIVPED